MKIRAALLDERGIFLRVVELESEAQITSRHLPQIKECDLPSGRYQWVPDDPVDLELNPYGGEFVSLELLARKNRPNFDRAFIDLVAAVEAKGIELPDSVKAWTAYSEKRVRRPRKEQRK